VYTMENETKNDQREIEVEQPHHTHRKRNELGQIILHRFPFLKKMKNTPTIIPLYYFFFSFGIIFLLGLALFNVFGSFKIDFTIAETGLVETFYFPVGDIISVILLGPVFSTFAIRTYELMREKVNPKKKKYIHGVLVSVLYITFVIIFNFGAISHMVGNQLHNYIYEIEIAQGYPIDPASILGALKAGIYLWDEVISHILIGIGFIGLLFINIHLDLISDEVIKILPYEFIMIVIGGFLLGVGTAIGFIEGQCAILCLILLGVLSILIIVIVKKNHYQYQKYPFLLCGLSMCIGFFVMVIIWIIYSGVKPYFPFLWQPSELFYVIG
jgi:hypothetical protein